MANWIVRKIRLSCSEAEVLDWLRFVTDRGEEFSQSLRQEGVRYEEWHLQRGNDALDLICVMDVDDLDRAMEVFASSQLSVDKRHREFMEHWEKSEPSDLPYPLPPDPRRELLLVARP